MYEQSYPRFTVPAVALLICVLAAACGDPTSKADDPTDAEGDRNTDSDNGQTTDTDIPNSACPNFSEPSAIPCPDLNGPECTAVEGAAKISALVSAGDLNVDGAVILSAATNLTGGTTGLDYYLVGILGKGRQEGIERLFLAVVRSDDPSVHTVNWLTGVEGTSAVGFDYWKNLDKWAALVCNETCTVVSSSATETEEAPLAPESGIDVLDTFVPTAAAADDNHGPLVVVGDGIARLEEDGTWTELVPADTGSAFRTAFSMGGGTSILAAGDNGKLVLYDDGDACDVKSEIKTAYTAVWARWFSANEEDDTLIVHAFTADGQWSYTDAANAVSTCAFAPNIRTAFVSGGAVLAVSADGTIYVTGTDVYHRTQCACRQFDGPIDNASSDNCGAGPNIIGWNDSTVFGDPKANCAVD